MNDRPVSALLRRWRACRRRAAVHPVKPFAIRRDDRPRSTPSQRLKPTLLGHSAMRDPFTTVSKICRWNAAISRRPFKCVPSHATKSARSVNGAAKAVLSPAFQASIIRRWMARIVSSSAAVCVVGCEFVVAPRNSFAVLVDIGRSSALESEQPRCAYIASRCNGVVQDAHLGE